jgi:hypothetical protein
LGEEAQSGVEPPHSKGPLLLTLLRVIRVIRGGPSYFFVCPRAKMLATNVSTSVALDSL